MRELVEQIAKQIENKIEKKPSVGIILGSGLAGIADIVENKTVIKYGELDGMLKSRVEGHKNQFVIGDMGGKTVICMQGRFHPYDGFTAKETALPIYLFKLLGVETLIVTNASGAINYYFDPGDVMAIKTHINFTGMNPLIGGPIIDYGEQFIDLKNCYDHEYLEVVKEVAKDLDIELKEGVYAQMLGPTYETPAEVEMLRTLGVDSVAMSTVLETIAARQCGLRTIGFSCITNKAINFNDEEVLSHEEVLELGKKASVKLKKIIPEFIKRI